MRVKREQNVKMGYERLKDALAGWQGKGKLGSYMRARLRQ
jgi:hypothetical protein